MKTSTRDNYQFKTNQILDYISANLHSPLKLDYLASLMNLSQRQLLRIIRKELNESLYAYIARERLQRAVMYMQTESISLIELAERVGYSNAQAFSKAFKKQFGISPKAYNDKLKSKLISFTSHLDPAQTVLTAELCDIEGIELIYIRIIGQYGEEESYSRSWNKLTLFLKEKKLLSQTTRYFGISFDDPNVTAQNKCRFYACASIDKEIAPIGEFGRIKIPQGKYARYIIEKGCTNHQMFYNSIAVNFPYKIRQSLIFEEYITEQDRTYTTKVYIPIY